MSAFSRNNETSGTLGFGSFFLDEKRDKNNVLLKQYKHSYIVSITDLWKSHFVYILEEGLFLC